MSLYRYRARDAQQKLRQGVVDAASEAEALRELLAGGLTPIELRAEGVSSTGARRRAAVGPAERMLLLQELATLLGAGIALAEVLPSMAQAYADSPLAGALSEMERLVRGGAGVADALALPGLAMPPYVLALARAGEASGALAEALRDAAAQLEQDLRARREMRTALIYPSVLVGAGSAAVLFILVVVVPRFATLLKGSRAEVPALSRWVIEAGVFTQQHLLALALVAGGLIAVAALLLSQPGPRLALWNAMARLPVIGDWLRQVDIGRWTLVLGSLLGNRVPIIDALQLSQAVLRVPALQADLAGAAPALSRGRSLADVLGEFGWFPRTRLNLVRVGERSGELPRLLRQLGEMETEAAQLMQKRVLALIEPIAILGIGVAIGVIMVAVLMAITSLNTAAV